MFDFKKYIEEKRQKINAALDEALPAPATGNIDSDAIVNAMKYSLMAGGKRLRPILCIAAAQAVGGNEDNVMEAACALEMAHTYSLIHDDLPAMDDDDLRRGTPTCHVKFGEAAAILAGDGLLTLAFIVLSKMGLKHENKEAVLRVTAKLAGALGHEGMIGGQIRDIGAEGKMISLEELKALHAMKTGALIEASVYAGAVLGGGNSYDIACLTRYASKIGLAFQVTDDILNVDGDPKLMGKAAGTDAMKQKATYPGLLGLSESRVFAENLIKEAVDALKTFDDAAEPLKALAGYIIERRR